MDTGFNSPQVLTGTSTARATFNGAKLLDLVSSTEGDEITSG